MPAELAIRNASIPEKIEYARGLAHSGMLPKQYQNKPENILWAIEYGETVGITPMAAITGVHVIEGKPSASAALIGGLVRRAGHKLRVTGDNRQATAQIVRSDDPDYVFSFTYSIEDAQRAGLTNKAVWKSYPAAMLRARAITQVARDACEEVLFGLHYTPEELGAEVDAEGEPLEPRTARQTGPVETDPWQTASAVAAANAAEPVEYAEEVEDRPPAATPEQVASIAAALQARGIKNRDQAREMLSDLAGRPIGAPVNLTAAEADRVVSALTAPQAEPDQAASEPPANAMGVSPGKMKAMHALLTKQGHTKAGGHALMSKVTGRTITSANQLTPKDVDDVLHTLNTGEIPGPSAPEPPGPDALGEGISEFDALDQMILDVTSDEAHDEVQQAITTEVARGTITATGAGVLRKRLADHVAQAKAGAGASA